MSAAQRTKIAVAVLAMVPVVALAADPVGALPTRHGPSARAVHASQRAVARDAEEVRRIAAEVGRARAQLRQLRVTAEATFEAYDEARVRLAMARAAVRHAHTVLAGANQQVDQGQARMSRFVTLSYETGGLGGIEAYLSPGGVGALQARMGALNAIDASEQRTVGALQAAQIYRSVVSRQAEGVALRASAAAATARRTKAAASAAVAHQAAAVTRIRQQRARLTTLLARARAHASALQRARLAAIARAQAAAAARAAAANARAATGSAANTGPSPYANESDSLAGTASAATELAALRAAEAQIGKPYVWAAAGPDTFDCSGLTLWAYASVGIPLLHYTGYQWTEGAHVAEANLRPGDLVFFATNTSDPATIHHVGMYVGSGEMVDAPFTGADVRYDPAFRSDYIGAVRPYQR